MEDGVNPVVVGVDGTDNAVRAARWAAGVAHKLGAPPTGDPTLSRPATKVPVAAAPTLRSSVPHDQYRGCRAAKRRVPVGADNLHNLFGT